MIGELNLSYYGIPRGRYGYCSWDNDIHIADLVNDNIYNLYVDSENHQRPSRWGKPFDNSVYLWYIKPDCSFARNAAFCADTGNTLNVVFAENIESAPVPLAISIVDRYTSDYGELSVAPHERVANDDTKPQRNLYNGLAYNIPYTSYCIHAQVGCMNYASNTIVGQNLLSLASWIDADPNNRDVWYIAPTLYTGSTTDRRPFNNSSDYFLSSETNKNGAPIPDILAYRPIPTNAEHVIAEILDGEPEGANWSTDKVFNPFSQAVGQNNFWRSGTLTSTTSYQLRLGLQQSILYSQLRNGYADYSTISPPSKTTGQFFKYSSTIQNYNDVSFRWVTKIYDTNSKYFIDNGYDITNMTGNARICTVLEIVDYKGHTKGEACQLACMHEVAAMGFYFTNLQSTAQTYELGGNGDYSGVYLPEIIDGVTTGYYTTGEDVKDVPYFDADDVSGFKYDGSSPSNTDNETHLPTEVTTIPRFNRTYLCDLTDIENFMGNLKSFDWSLDNLNELFFGQDPYEFIISLSAFPLVDYPLSPAATKHDITLGKLNLNELPDKVGDCEGYPIMGGIVQIPNPFGTITVQKYYSLERNGGFDFLDYEPYTKIFLYLPYCGMVSIPPSVFMGKEIRIDMSWDTLSGNIICYILVENDGVFTEYTTAQGNILTDVPVSGRAYSEYMKAQTDMTTDMITGLSDSVGSVAGHVAGASVSATFGNPLGVGAQVVQGVTAGVSGAARFIRNYYELTQTQPSPITISNGSASIGTGNDQDAHLYILRPILPDNFDAETFTKVSGRATGYAGKLRTSKGFTQMINPILDGINCTAEEKMLIIQALADGVIL